MKTPTTILLAATLAALAPFATAQGHDHTTTRGDEAKVASLERGEEDTARLEGRRSDAATARTAGVARDIQRRYALDLRLVEFEPAALRLEVEPASGETGDIFIVVCVLDDDLRLRPVALLDASDARQTTLGMELQAFARLPIALFAARMKRDGRLEHSEIESARQLADDAIHTR